MARKRALCLINQRPSNPINEALTWRQVEYLVDEIVCAGHHDPAVNEALILLMDEIERLALTSPVEIENITRPVKRNAYYRLKETEVEQQALITELRRPVAGR